MPEADAFEPLRILPDATRLREGATVRFRVRLHGIEREALALRWRGRLAAHLNVCRHQSLPLDFGDGRFLDDDGVALVCVHHGARYHPATGACISGPCAGSRLTGLAVEERDGALWCLGLRAADAPEAP